LVGVLALAACGTLPDGHRWGQDVTMEPGWKRVGSAAAQAVRNPNFWAPLLVGGVLQIDNWDHRLSGWARRKTPLFGSEANATLWSDRLRSAAVVASWGSILLAPSGSLDTDGLVDKLKGSAVDVAAAESAIEFTSGLKRLTQRERPNGYDDQSMPSDHTTTSAVYDELAVRNVQLSGINPTLQTAADISLGALTAATGWARIEAGAHYPSDTLVGASIGEFFANFFTDAFLAPTSPHLRLASLPGGAELQFGQSF
jgi:membrane-associated phospholipid phosphatase